jgi:hypothetical protein
MDHDAHAWLFVRGEESIRITTGPARTLLIFGPGEARQSCDFTDAAALTHFLESYQQRLLDDGWILGIIAERRRPDRQAPPERERRATERRTQKSE